MKISVLLMQFDPFRRVPQLTVNKIKKKFFNRLAEGSSCINLHPSTETYPIGIGIRANFNNVYMLGLSPIFANNQGTHCRRC